MWLVMMMM